MGDTSAEPRFKALDGLRGLAVLQVVLYHLYLLKPDEGNWYKILQRLGNAIDGVTVFFVLSGFLIGGILLDTRGNPGGMRVFYIRRLCRIVPLYLVLMATYGLIRLIDVQWQLGFIYSWYTEIPLWSYLVFWQNEEMTRYVALGAPWLAVTWSLAVEQQFYLITPWVVRYLPSRRLLAAVCFTSMLLAGLNRFGTTGLRIQLVDRLDALAAGVLLALAMRDAAARGFLVRGRGVLRLLLVLYFLTLFGLRLAKISSPIIDNLFTAGVMYAVLTFLLVDSVPWWPVKPVIERFAPIGLWSYFIYLFHMPVMFTFQELLPAAAPAALPVTAGLAYLSYRHFERPLIRWGHRLNFPSIAAPPKSASTGVLPT